MEPRRFLLRRSKSETMIVMATGIRGVSVRIHDLADRAPQVNNPHVAAAAFGPSVVEFELQGRRALCVRQLDTTILRAGPVPYRSKQANRRGAIHVKHDLSQLAPATRSR
jgi:hypothetical protein